MNKKAKQKFSLDKILIILIGVVLAVYTLTIIAVLLWGFITSLKSDMDFQILKNVWKLPNPKYSSEELKFGNYFYIFEKFSFRSKVEFYSMFGKETRETRVDFWGLCVNTLLLAVGGALLTTFFPMLVSYLCAKYKYKFSSIVYWFVVIIMAIPTVGVYPAELEMLRALNLYDTFFGYFLQKSYFTGMYFLVFFAFFQGVDNSYIEAAEIDGANDYKIMFTVMFPLAMKMFTSVLLIHFVQFWNDYQTANLYMPTHPTLAYGVWRVAFGSNDGFIKTTSRQLASCMLLAIPIIVVYAVFRDKLMGNLSMGGVKG